MHMEFTEEERRYLVRDPFDWHPSEDAPARVRRSILRKTRMLDTQEIGAHHDRQQGKERRA